MLSAAALMATATTTVTNAKGSGSASLVVHSPSGASYCDTYKVYWSGANYADQVDWTPCGISSHSIGMGITSAKKKNKSIAISDSYKGDTGSGFEVDWQFGIPIQSGKVFNAYYTTNGSSVTEYIAGGSYQVVGGARQHVHPSHLSTISALPTRVQK
jgi:hypothetical protein